MPTPQQFKLTWVPNVDDTKMGFALAAWGSRGRLLRTVVLLFVLPSIVFSMLLLDIPVRKPSIPVAVAIGIVASCISGPLFLILFSSIFGRQLARRQRERGGTQTVLITDEGIERCLRATRVRHTWQAISRVDELPAAFLLYSDGTLVGSIEKSATAKAQELTALRTFIRAKKPGRTIGRTLFALETKDAGEG